MEAILIKRNEIYAKQNNIKVKEITIKNKNEIK